MILYNALRCGMALKGRHGPYELQPASYIFISCSTSLIRVSPLESSFQKKSVRFPAFKVSMYERRSHDAKADLDEAIGNLSIGRGPRFVPQDGNDLDESLQLSQQAPQHRPIEIPTNVPGRDPGGDDISPKSRVGEGWHAALGPKEGYTPTVNLDRRVSCERIVCCVSIGSSGKLFAAGCIQFIHVCEVETGQILQTFHHGTEIYVKNVCFSPDESLLAAGDSNGTIRVRPRQ